MNSEMVPLILAGIIFLSSLISLKVGLSVSIIEITLGAIAGNLGLKPLPWMAYIAGFGGIILTFLAGTEIDTRLFKEKFKESFLIGLFSFLTPFMAGFLFAFFLKHWSYKASLITGIALSSTSLAVVYSVLVETHLSKQVLGKSILSATFVTNMGSALALSLLFVEPTIYTLLFYIVSFIVIVGAVKFSHWVFHHPGLKNKVIEPEIKYIFLLLFTLMVFADIGKGQAVLPAFLLGLFMSGHFSENSETKELKNRLRTVAYAFITPMFNIVGGLKISFPMIAGMAGLFTSLLAIKISAKFAGVYFFVRKYMPGNEIYSTLLLSTGLTFGTIACLFGYQSGIIDQLQYSVLLGAVVASAVLPTFIAQKWFFPKYDEDLVDMEEES